MVGYYDYLLGSLPFVLTAPAGLAYVAGTGIETGILVGGAASLALIVHALFWRSPLNVHVESRLL